MKLHAGDLIVCECESCLDELGAGRIMIVIDAIEAFSFLDGEMLPIVPEDRDIRIVGHAS